MYLAVTPLRVRALTCRANATDADVVENGAMLVGEIAEHGACPECGWGRWGITLCVLVLDITVPGVR